MEAGEVSRTRAWVLHPDLTSDRQRRAAEPALDEAVALAEALPSIEVVGAEIVSLPRPRPGLLFGKGKLEELKSRFDQNEVELVLVDGPVTPVQQRNLEREWKLKILDRTSLILEIFSDRARTREGVLQVEMAALSYQRTRLVRAWTHLERQRGALGFVGGPGETQIEADRRAIDEALVRLRRQLDKVVKTRELHRSARAKVPYPIVALVGYTNAGKSSLFNRLTGASVVAKDMLFATLDPTMRVIELRDGQEVILSDTVGFISDLPTQLIAAFRATLEEVLAADLICHVHDVSHPETKAHAADVTSILTELGVTGEIPILNIWNKIDVLNDDARAALEAQAARSDDAVIASALTGEGLGDLRREMARRLSEERTREVVDLHYGDGRRRAWLHQQGVVEAETEAEDGIRLTVNWTGPQAARFRKLG
ncbi:GTPase HflX [Roseitranquillus sediminis]|uniref:GTPase HflX n=1 Tax=Roseitranquillus sediminis TaxID=2809051 RepID=UPI001D0CC6F4|nr:GTPase HflX [Roseitranquillus sediminis]MBM9595561.1 GTPase HflX [Roseitranquillus sediminis]